MALWDQSVAYPGGLPCMDQRSAGKSVADVRPDHGWHTPLLLQPCSDKPHASPTSAEIAALAPNIEVQTDWRGPAFLASSIKRVVEFLANHTPE